MRKTLVRFAALAALLLPAAVLVSCATPPPQTTPDLTYKHLAPISLDAAAFDVETRYIPPLAGPNVEHLSPVTPYAAARQWGQDRIRTAGMQNTARLVILDASIVETDLPVEGGVSGMFTTSQAKRYEGRIAVLLEILDPNRRQLAFATARAERSRSAPEDITIAQREKLWLEMTEAMMKDINAELEKNIRQHFGRYVLAR